MAYEEVKTEGNLWKPVKEGESLEGEVVGVNKNGKFGIQLTVKKADGVEKVTPSHKVLQSMLTGLNVGDKVLIKYIKTELPTVKGQNGAMLYQVFVERMVSTEQVK